MQPYSYDENIFMNMDFACLLIFLLFSNLEFLNDFIVDKNYTLHN